MYRDILLSMRHQVLAAVAYAWYDHLAGLPNRNGHVARRILPDPIDSSKLIIAQGQILRIIIVLGKAPLLLGDDDNDLSIRIFLLVNISR